MTENRRILATIERDRFFGRDEIVTRLCDPSTRSVVIGAEPGIGLTETLLQSFDEMFRAGGETAPIYFKFSENDRSIAETAQRFAREFLQQAVAFRRSDTSFLSGSHNPAKLLYLLPSADIGWADRSVNAINMVSGDFTYSRECFSASLRAAARGRSYKVFLDGFQFLKGIDADNVLLDDLKKIVESDAAGFVVAGWRRSVYGKFRVENCELPRLSLGNTGDVISSRAEELGLEVSGEARDLITVQLDSDLNNVSSLLQKAADKKIDLNSYLDVQRVYTEEIFGGYIGRRFDRIVDDVLPLEAKKNELLSILFDSAEIDAAQIPIGVWQTRLGLSQAETSSLIDKLDRCEIIRVSSGRAGTANEDRTMTDLINVRFRLNIAYENRAIVFGEMLRSNIARAPKIMAEYYRRLSALGLRQFFEAFRGESVPRALVDYGSFSAEYKGAPNHEILSDLRHSDDHVNLPHVVFATNTSAMYRPILKFTERERSVVALGYVENATANEEIVIVSAEIDSKLEATAELTEFWCDRLEMAAIMCGFENFSIWLVSPEGFLPEAVEILRHRNAYGLSKKQIELLSGYLNIENVMRSRSDADGETYEIVLPMSGETEMIAAHTIEDIARRYNFDMKAIKQIKTAVVEAYINAAEHSLSPDKKIYQSLKVDEKGLNLVISNRGLRLKDKLHKQQDVEAEGRRGWGLKLMKSLMDEVEIETVDDGTRIRMKKYFTQTA